MFTYNINSIIRSGYIQIIAVTIKILEVYMFHKVFNFQWYNCCIWNLSRKNSKHVVMCLYSSVLHLFSFSPFSKAIEVHPFVFEKDTYTDILSLRMLLCKKFMLYLYVSSVFIFYSVLSKSCVFSINDFGSCLLFNKSAKWSVRYSYSYVYARLLVIGCDFTCTWHMLYL